MIVVLYQRGAKGGTSSAFKIITSILLLQDGKIPRQSNLSAVSVNDKKQKSPGVEFNNQSLCIFQQIPPSINIICMELIRETNFANTVQFSR